MKKIISRLFLFFIVFPALVIMIVVLPHYRHLVLNMLAVLASALGAVEVAAMFRQRGVVLGTALTVSLGILLPLTAYAEIMGFLPANSLLAAALLGLSVLIAVPSFVSRNEDFPAILQNVSAGALALVYPGLFLSFAVMISSFEGSSILLSVFIVSVYLNDALAYAVGNLMGGDNRNIVAVSPNKSLSGFIAGYITSPAVFLVSFYLFPSLFGNSLWKALVIGAVIGFTTILGDLLESALKRSAGVKDSGTIIPGRGGVLDSIDSVIFSAPFFYYLYSVLI